MAKLRYISTRIWEDHWFSELDQIEQLVFIYFLTNPTTNIIGAYELSKGTIGRGVGLERRMLDEILGRFEKAGKVYYVNGWVIVPNFIKHQNYKSPQMQIGIIRELKSLPEKVFIVLKPHIPYIYGIDTISHLTKPNLTKPNRIRSNKPTKRKEIVFSKEIYNKIIDLYQKLKGITLQGNEFKPIQQEIKTMLLSGRKLEDILKCMEWMSSDDFYTNHWTIKTVRFKLPEFLAGNLEEEAEVPSYAR